MRPSGRFSLENTMDNQPLFVWVMDYYDTVAGEKSLDLYKTEEMAHGTICDVLIYQRMVWQ